MSGAGGTQDSGSQPCDAPHKTIIAKVLRVSDRLYIVILKWRVMWVKSLQGTEAGTGSVQASCITLLRLPRTDQSSLGCLRRTASFLQVIRMRQLGQVSSQGRKRDEWPPVLLPSRLPARQEIAESGDVGPLGCHCRTEVLKEANQPGAISSFHRSVAQLLFLLC